MKRLRVMTVVGTRPEIIRLSRVIAALDNYFDHVFVHTGQNYDYELNQIFFQDMAIREPDVYLGAAGESAAETIGNIIIAMDKVLLEHKPDALLILGDTNSCLSAIAAKRHKVPIFHMEAGNRCFDQRVPEETNRKIVDGIADINLTYSTIARDYLLSEGQAPDRVIKTGITGRFEVAEEMVKLLGKENEIKITSVDSDFWAKEYFSQRPPSERLINKKLDLRELNIMRDWKVCLKEYLDNYYQGYLD